MPNYLADTMAVVSHFANRRLGHQAAEIFRETDGDEHQIFLVPELHDRMIAATGKYHQLPVITNDPVLAKSKHITTIW